METIATVGLDLAKSIFQVHAIDALGGVVVRRALRRANLLDLFRKLPPCLIGMEACATAHFWAREIQACGHEVKIIPPVYVKAYVKRSKTDAADADASQSSPAFGKYCARSHNPVSTDTAPCPAAQSCVGVVRVGRNCLPRCAPASTPIATGV